MKKLLLLIIIPFLSFGQDLTYVPDDGFEDWIENNINGASNGYVNDNYVFTDALQPPQYMFTWPGGPTISQTIPIYDLTGIEDFIINGSLAIQDLYVSEINLSEVEFMYNPSQVLFIKWNQYLEKIILPKDSVGRIHLSENNPVLKEVEFQDELAFNYMSLDYSAMTACELSFKGMLIDGSPEIRCFNLCPLETPCNVVSLNFSLLSQVPFGTKISLNALSPPSYINLNNDFPIYNWELNGGVPGFLFGQDNLCVEVNDPEFCYNNNDWPQEFFNAYTTEFGNINYTNNCNTPDCSPISVLESPEITKHLLKTIDILGRKTTNKGFQLHIYDDGSVEKKYLIK